MNKTFGIVLILIISAGFLVLVMKKGGLNSNNMTNNAMTPVGKEIKITPISHATMVLNWGDKVVYTDPVGGAGAFAGQPEPDLVLVTDIHGDHLDTPTLQAVLKAKTTLVVPKAVFDKLPKGLSGTLVVMANGEKKNVAGFSVEAVPMYNVPQVEGAYHTKGRGNGYVVEALGKRVYFSGDTSNIPEMKNLKNIDIAFLCMNLPYTMSVEEADLATVAIKPKVVVPYHYRGSDTTKFRELVNAKDSSITVDLIDFYPSD